MKRVVVTGLGALTPIGNNLPAYLSGLQHGVSGANLITRFDTAAFKTKFACEIKDFNIEDYVDKKEARKMDIFCHYAMVCADEAITHAGIPEAMENIWPAMKTCIQNSPDGFLDPLGISVGQLHSDHAEA